MITLIYIITLTGGSNREDVNIKKLVEDKEAIIVQFKDIHYQAICLEDEGSHEYEWPMLESHNIFTTNVNHKLCPICNKLTYSKRPSADCILSELWVHCDEDSDCLKYWEDIDVTTMETNFYCSVCLDKLVSFQRSIGEVCCIDSIINCLHSFNLEGVDIKNEEELEILNIVIGNLIEIEIN